LADASSKDEVKRKRDYKEKRGIGRADYIQGNQKGIKVLLVPVLHSFDLNTEEMSPNRCHVCSIH